MKKIIYLLAVLVLTSCATEKSDSEEIKEAKAINEAIKILQEDVDNKIHQKMDEVNIKLEEAIAMSDSISAVKINEAEDALYRIHDTLDEWRANLLELPEEEHNHEECDHDHSHDHEKEKLLEGLSDKEILEIQQELKQSLDKISDEVDAVTFN